MYKSQNVKLVLKANTITADVVSSAILQRANPHYQTLIEDRLSRAGITVENTSKYFRMIAAIVSEFWAAQWDRSFTPTLRSHEVRGLYLPLIMGVIFSSVGNCKVGNYEYQLSRSSEEIDKKFVFDYSATLEANRDLVKGAVGQIGNYAATVQAPVMLSILGEIASDERSAEMRVRDGVTVDSSLAGLSVLAGLTLVDSAFSILYTGYEEVNFREVTDTLVERSTLDKSSIV
jgi:hypothetical protein